MNKLSLGKLPKGKGNLSSIKLPNGVSITTTQVALIALCLIFLGVAIYFAISYFGAVGKRADLENSIQAQQGQINAMGGLQNIAALQSQLEDAQQDLIDESPFPFAIDYIDATYLILEAQTEAHISCLQYDPQWSKGSTSINSNPYAVNTFRMTASGIGSEGEKMNKIIHFLSNLEELPYNAISMKQVSLSRVSEEDMWSISFTLEIVSQQ